MGLDLVEMVLRLEEGFETEIPDRVAGTLIKPRDVIDYLITKPEIRNKGMSREAVAEKVWRIMEDELGINANDFDEDAHFIEDMHIN